MKRTLAASVLLLLTSSTSNAFTTTTILSRPQSALCSTASQTNFVRITSIPPPWQQQQQQQQQQSDVTSNDFETNVGQAIDTLRSDYPDMLTSEPDYSIYSDDVELVEPNGIVKLNGLDNYKRTIGFFQAMMKWCCLPELSLLQHHLVHDCARMEIRVSWHAQLMPKKIIASTPMHVDGISVYRLSRTTGRIVQHRMENLVWHDDRSLQRSHVFANQNNGGGSIPVAGLMGTKSSSMRVDFKMPLPWQQPQSLLFLHATNNEDDGSDEFDDDAYERKNASRKKFGLKPLSREEFVSVQSQIAEMEMAQKQKYSEAGAVAKQQKKRVNPLKNLFGDALKDTCESNWDCQRPEVCCDFKVKKMCCSAGELVGTSQPLSRYGERATIPIPITPDDGYHGPW
eukprot:CAMPEP_0118723794 /NCGR_PEP_ID=MMETSP0800-20121206/32199_1 /TAXON_ID=210618 ORGANISM="Striatella unipunctata, Strain CCMP2910" /NCGR_SAMPLE_ID=MMETSP0800 /ASSEMBLY_ACC=CAM_ASM_000638 /LENGTH=397 /DNA_ID=CAMNT_0006632255 /DNA_START=121 /DNA_END=1312 /DNA_ORIENTATION=-